MYDTFLYQELINKPTHVIPIFDNVASEVFFENFGKKQTINFQPCNLRTKHIGLLKESDFGKLVYVEGTVNG